MLAAARNASLDVSQISFYACGKHAANISKQDGSIPPIKTRRLMAALRIFCRHGVNDNVDSVVAGNCAGRIHACGFRAADKKTSDAGSNALASSAITVACIKPTACGPFTGRR